MVEVEGGGGEEGNGGGGGGLVAPWRCVRRGSCETKNSGNEFSLR